LVGVVFGLLLMGFALPFLHRIVAFQLVVGLDVEQSWLVHATV
jgi:hypothetical protein